MKDIKSSTRLIDHSGVVVKQIILIFIFLFIFISSNNNNRVESLITFPNYCICYKLYPSTGLFDFDPFNNPRRSLSCQESTGYKCSDPQQRGYYYYNRPTSDITFNYRLCPTSTFKSLTIVSNFLNLFTNINCACDIGYYISNSSTCVQRTCTINNGGCDQICHSNQTCSCNQGWKLGVDGGTCIDKCGTGQIWQESSQSCLMLPVITNYNANLMYKQSGNITIQGGYFNYNNNISVSIGNTTCNHTYGINASTVVCLFDGMVPPDPSGNALPITIVIDNFKSISRSIFYYVQGIYCPNNCSSQGVCNHQTGECTCNEGYDLFDCSLLKSDYQVPPPTPDGNGGFVFGKQGKFNFSLSITHIRELDIQDTQIKVLNISSINWTDKTPSLGSDGRMHYLYRGGWTYEKVEFTINVTYFATEGSVVFADETILVPNNSIKYQIQISNWNFATQLSTLELVYHSNSEDVSPCAESSASVFTMSDDSTPFPYFDLQSNGATIKGRFASRLIVDDRYLKNKLVKLGDNDILYTYITSRPGSTNILLANPIPYFLQYATLDPSFAIIVGAKQDTTSSTCSSNNELGWKVPVIVVCSCVGTAVLIIATVLIVKSKTFRIQIKELKLKRIT